MIKEDTLISWLWDMGYTTDADTDRVIRHLKEKEELGNSSWELLLRVSPFSGYSAVYTQDVVEEIETAIRKILDDKIGYLNTTLERNYSITREDWPKDGKV
jgi:hypothetical protein